MQPLNEKQAQQVWSRVMRAQAVPAAELQAQPREDAAQQAQSAEDSPLEARELLPLLAQTRADSALYTQLAARMKGRAQQQLRELSRQARCHARTLAAISFLMTGQKPCPERPARPCVTCINQTLREQYVQERAAAEQYTALAARAGSYADALQGIAEQKRQHAKSLFCILQDCL